MRLLDQVAHHSTPFSVSVDAHGANEQIGRVTTVPGPADFAHRVAGCPLRYVLSDDLVAVCTDLALAGGDRLSSCLDLWVEWSDAARDRALAELAPKVGMQVTGPEGGARTAGALISCSACGRRGLLRTFWSDEQGAVTLAPMETHLDLDRG